MRFYQPSLTLRIPSMRTREEISKEIGSALNGIMEEKLIQKNILIVLLDIRDLLINKHSREEVGVC